MNKIKAIATACLMIGLAGMTFTPTAFGEDSEGINVTLTPSAVANITLDQGSWEPTCGVGESNNTTQTWGTCSNDGTVKCNVTVNITEDAGTVWEIMDTYPTTTGYNIVSFGFYNSSAWTLLNETGTNFGTIAHEGSKSFGLNVTMPTSTETNDDQHFTITFTATAYGME